MVNLFKQRFNCQTQASDWIGADWCGVARPGPPHHSHHLSLRGFSSGVVGLGVLAQGVTPRPIGWGPRPKITRGHRCGAWDPARVGLSWATFIGIKSLGQIPRPHAGRPSKIGPPYGWLPSREWSAIERLRVGAPSAQNKKESVARIPRPRNPDPRNRDPRVGNGVGGCVSCSKMAFVIYSKAYPTNSV